MTSHTHCHLHSAKTTIFPSNLNTQSSAFSPSTLQFIFGWRWSSCSELPPLTEENSHFLHFCTQNESLFYSCNTIRLLKPIHESSCAVTGCISRDEGMQRAAGLRAKHWPCLSAAQLPTADAELPTPPPPNLWSRTEKPSCRASDM